VLLVDGFSRAGLLPTSVEFADYTVGTPTHIRAVGRFTSLSGHLPYVPSDFSDFRYSGTKRPQQPAALSLRVSLNTVAQRPTPENSLPITHEIRALAYFVDRQDFVDRFNQYMNGDTPPGSLLFLHGVGGIGKTTLLSFLRKHCCQPITSIEPLNGVSPAALRKAYGKTPTPFPSTWVDCGNQPHGTDDPRDPEFAPLMLRRQLAANGFRFPLFDFAYIWYLHVTRQLSPARLGVFPTDEISLIGAVVDAVSLHPFGAVAGAVLNVFGKHWKDKASLFWKRRQLDIGDVEGIQILGSDNPDLIIDELPAYLAADLNSWMRLAESPKRVILFFDRHEAFWGQEKRSLSELDFHAQDQWLRYLLKSLESNNGIVAVVAGRELPRWHKAAKHGIPTDNVETILVGNLPRNDALAYLDLVGVNDPALMEAACTAAEVRSGQVHPLYLGLCADILTEAQLKRTSLDPQEFSKRRKADIGPALIAQLMRNTDSEIADAVYALAACRSFNRDVYYAVMTGVHCQGSLTAFNRLIGFSFVSAAEGREAGWYVLHDLLRSLINEADSDLTKASHAVLEVYYRRQGGAAAVVEVIYHACRIDATRGVRELVERFDAAIWASDYALCRALLGLRSLLGRLSGSNAGLLARCQGDYFSLRGLYKESVLEYKTALNAFEAAYCEDKSSVLQKQFVFALNSQAEVQCELSRYAEGIASYKRAEKLCIDLLKSAPDDVETHTLLSESYLGLADANIWRAKSNAASRFYSRSDAVLNKALSCLMGEATDEWMGGELGGSVVDRSFQETRAYLLQQKGYALGGLADVEASLYRHVQAISKYEEAQLCYGLASEISSSPVILNDLAYTLVAKAESECELVALDAALSGCGKAVVLFEKILLQAPEDNIYRVNRAMAFRVAGVSLMQSSRYEEALGRFDVALNGSAEVLKSIPTDAWALYNEGLSFLNCGQLRLKMGDTVAALKCFDAGKKSCAGILEQMEDDDEALATLGRLLFYEGEARRKDSTLDAIALYKQSETALNRVLRSSPDDGEAERDRALCLLRMGESYFDINRRDQARVTLGKALKGYNRYLRAVPHHIGASEGRARTKALLGGRS